MDVHQPGRARPRIGWIVAGLALVPLVGLIAFAVREVRVVAQDRVGTNAVVEASERSVRLVHLAAAVDDEKYWTYVLDALATLNIEPGALVPIVGIDVEAEYESALDDVEYWLDALGSAAIGLQVHAIRNDDRINLDDRIAAFEPVENELEALLQLELDNLLRNATLLPNSEKLIDAARVLEAAAAVRNDMAWQLGGYFGSQFQITRSTEEYVRMLVERSERYHTHMADLVRLAPAGSQVIKVIPEIQGDPNVQGFIANTERQIDLNLSGEAFTSALDIEAEMEEPSDIATTFITAVNATEAHLPLVNAAADDITREAFQIRHDANRQLTFATSAWAAVTLISLLAALATTQILVRPLRRMSGAAASLRSGSLDVTVDERGPREIQTAARAMNEAIDSLKLVERQAIALADGDLDDPVLDAETPGRLGASLRRAVARLTDSLAEREDYRRRLAHEASHDALTGLANRRSAIEHLSQALARSRRTDMTVAVLFVDLDGFKAVNDLHGHQVGDLVLAKIAQRVAMTIRKGDLAGRMGGDEFIVVAEPVSSESHALMLAERLAKALSEPLTTAGITIVPHCSIGVALPASLESTAEEVIHDADLAVYEAKRRGRSEVVVCSDDLRRQVSERSTIERGLSAAIANDELELHFQTVVDSRSVAPIGLEALVRWRRADGSLIPPIEFIPVAERSDLILDMDLWVLDRAARHLADWSQTPLLSELNLAVNLSSRHIVRSDLAERVLTSLQTHGVDPARLVIEVTESALLDDLDAAGTQLRQLRAQGVRVAIDDFGTGFTSLTHLRTLPADILKIDGSYTRNLSASKAADLGLIRLIIEVGHLLGLEVTAEGVETAEQVAILSELGADALQGFHFSRPIPADQLVASLDPEDPGKHLSTSAPKPLTA